MGTTTAIVAIVLGSITFVSTIVKLLAVGYRWGRRVEKALTYIEGEMRHNGGSTMRDHVVRMDGTLNAISGRLDQLEATHGQHPFRP